MIVREGVLVTGMVWGMLLTGAALVLASLWRASERFWYWKQARQMALGEVTPSAEALRIGQRFRLLPSEKAGKQEKACLAEAHDRSIIDADSSNALGLAGQIVDMRRGLLVLRVESEAMTRQEERALRQHQPVQVGQTWTVQIAGASELFRFTADVRRVCPDPHQPLCMLVTVELPFWLARIQRRQHARAPINVGVMLQKAVTQGSGTWGANALRGTLCDLSGGGLRLELDGAHSPEVLAELCGLAQRDELLQCTLQTPLLRQAPLYLRVHACERIVVRGGLSLRLRGEFERLPSWQQETLVSLVFQSLRQHLQQNAPRLEAGGSRL